MFLFNHPPVQRLTSSAVLPFALPYVWPLTSGKNSGHCRWKKSALIMRDTSVDSHHGAALFLGEIRAGHARVEDVRLPVEKWLVTAEPQPCPEERVSGAGVGVHRAGLIVRIEAFDAVLVLPVAIRLAGWLVSFVFGFAARTYSLADTSI